MTWSHSSNDGFLTLVSRIDRDTHRLDLDGTGAFWEAVRLGHALGRVGKGASITVCDTGFADPFEADVVESRFLHGTVVSAIISGIAPGASFNHVLLRGGAEGFRHTLAELAGAKPQIVNISAGKRRTLEESWSVHGDTFPAIYTAEPQTQRTRVESYTCSYCPSAEALAAQGSLITAAVGNGFDLEEDARGFVHEYWCPAWSPNVISVGFIEEHRDGAVAQALPPQGWEQGSEVAWAIEQPGKNVEGSSFAAPLAAGALALVDDHSVVPAMLDVKVRHWLTMALYPADYGLSARRAEVHRTLQSLYDSVPSSHRHRSASGPCYECSLFLSGLLSDFGMVSIHVGLLAPAIDQLTKARVLVPWSPDIAANLGAAYRLLGDGTSSSRRELLLKSRDMYRAALELRPDSEYFRALLRRVEDDIDRSLY